ncbi:MAG: glycoside hydrolase family 9 protein [Bacteroidales bacterium]|nr:glycoside hydrolase family 9 protein [Bacteroidales bacterium]
MNKFTLILLSVLLPCLLTAQERHFPLPVDESRSMLSRWAQKGVLSSVVVDDMEQEGRWKVLRGKPELSYTRENCKDGAKAIRQHVSLVDEEVLSAHRTPWNTFNGEQGGETCVALEFPEPQDWSAYNRISLWVYIHPSRNPNVSFALDLITDTPDGTYTPSRETNVDIPQGKWVQVLWEIEALKRDKVLRFEICQTCTGYDRAIGEPSVTIDFDRLELQKVAADHYEGWDLPSGQFAFSHTGYLPKADKVALSGPSKARCFSLVNEKGRTVFRGKARKVSHGGNVFMQLDFSRFRKAGRYRIRYGKALSEAFSIGPEVWEEPLWSALNFYFCQRCGYPVEGIHDVCHADSQAFWKDQRKTVNGGWHDAGDLSQGYWRTAYATYALLGALEVAPQAMQKHLADEARWGLEWLLKVRFPEGRHHEWNTLRYYSDNIVGTLDDVASPAGFVPWESYLGISALMRALQSLPLTKSESRAYIEAAEEDWKAVSAVGRWDWASFLEAAWGATASALLYRQTGKAEYREAALRWAERLLQCQQREAVAGVLGYFSARDSHTAFNEAPMIALSVLSEVFPELSAPWKEAARLFLDAYLKPGSRFTAPYYLLPAGVYPEEDKPVRAFPLWMNHVFHGATNVHLSQAWALAQAATLLDDKEALDLVQTQLEWTLGRNPFSSSLMYGVGYNFAPNFAYCTRNIAGAIPVGMDSLHDDLPFWNGTAHATAHEIWMEPVSRFVGALTLYLKARR